MGKLSVYYYHPLPPPKIGGGVYRQYIPLLLRRGQGVVIIDASVLRH
jgi:hypothetical protein